MPRNPDDVIKQMLSLETAQLANSFDRECWEFFFRSIPVEKDF